MRYVPPAIVGCGRVFRSSRIWAAGFSLCKWEQDQMGDGSRVPAGEEMRVVRRLGGAEIGRSAQRCGCNTVPSNLTHGYRYGEVK